MEVAWEDTEYPFHFVENPTVHQLAWLNFFQHEGFPGKQVILKMHQKESFISNVHVIFPINCNHVLRIMATQYDLLFPFLCNRLFISATWPNGIVVHYDMDRVFDSPFEDASHYDHKCNNNKGKLLNEQEALNRGHVVLSPVQFK